MRLLLQLGIVVCRFVKRGPGAIVGLALLLACGVGLASWYRDLPVTEPQTPETLAREYVDLIFTGRYAEAEEYAKVESRTCSRGDCFLDPSLATPIEYPQLVELTVKPRSAERNNESYQVLVRYTLGGKESWGSFTIVKQPEHYPTPGVRTVGGWMIDKPWQSQLMIRIDDVFASASVGDLEVYQGHGIGSGRRSYSWEYITMRGYPAMYDLNVTKIADRWLVLIRDRNNQEVDYGDYDSVPFSLGEEMSIEAVMAPEDYDELYVQVERELRACLRGEPSPVCTRQLSGKGEEGAVLTVVTDLWNRPSLDSVTEEDTLSVEVTFPDGRTEFVRVKWRYSQDSTGTVSITLETELPPVGEGEKGMTMRLIRYVKRGPGAFVGLALLLVLGVLGCTAYGDSLRSQITPEQAVRAYVQLIIDGKYSEAEKVIPARDKRCGGRSCRVGDDISELRVEAPQLLDVTVNKDCGERHVRCSAKVRLLVGGVEQEYQLSLTRDESEGSPVTGWWHLDGALYGESTVVLDPLFATATFGDDYEFAQAGPTAPTGSQWRIIRSAYPGVYELRVFPLAHHWRHVLSDTQGNEWWSGESDSIPVSLGGNYQLSAVLSERDYNDVHVDAEQEIQRCVRGEESRVCLQRLRGHSAEGMRVSFDDSPEDVAVWKSPIDLHETGVTLAYADGTSSHFNLWWRFAVDGDDVHVTYTSGLYQRALPAGGSGSTMNERAF